MNCSAVWLWTVAYRCHLSDIISYRFWIVRASWSSVFSILNTNKLKQDDWFRIDSGPLLINIAPGAVYGNFLGLNTSFSSSSAAAAAASTLAREYICKISVTFGWWFDWVWFDISFPLFSHNRTNCKKKKISHRVDQGRPLFEAFTRRGSDRILLDGWLW